MKVCWNITNLCNEDCIYCFRELNEGALPLEDNLDILYKLAESGVERITFAGGEPLLYPNIDILIKTAKELGIQTGMITNGKYLNVSTLDKYLPYLDKLTFSIDSPSDYVNNYSGRGKDHYKHILELLPFINVSYPDLYIKINSVITKENIDEVDYMYEAIANELQYCGIKEWKLLRFLALRGHAKLRKQYLDLEDYEFESIANRFHDSDAFFKISARDKYSLESDITVSPNGGLKTAEDEIEYVLIDDLREASSEDVVKKLRGGRHV